MGEFDHAIPRAKSRGSPKTLQASNATTHSSPKLETLLNLNHNDDEVHYLVIISIRCPFCDTCHRWGFKSHRAQRQTARYSRHRFLLGLTNPQTSNHISSPSQVRTPLTGTYTPYKSRQTNAIVLLMGLLTLSFRLEGS